MFYVFIYVFFYISKKITADLCFPVGRHLQCSMNELSRWGNMCLRYFCQESEEKIQNPTMFDNYITIPV